MSSEAPQRNFEAPQQAKQEVPAFSAEYVQQLVELKDRMDGKGKLGMEGKEKADKKVQSEVLKTLNGSGNSYRLVKSEIEMTNFIDKTAGPAFVLPGTYDDFMKTSKGPAFLNNVVTLGTQSLARQYTEGFKSQQEHFNRAHNTIVTKPYLDWQNDPNVKIVSKVAENLGKPEKDVTFEEVVKSGLLGIKPPSIEEIVKAGLTSMEYANPRTDRQAYNKIQKRKRMVESYMVEDILSFDTGKKLTSEKSKDKAEKMLTLNKARQSIDADVRKIVSEFTKTKDVDLRFYATDGKESDGMPKDLSFAAKSMPQIVIANGQNPLMVIDVAIHNGRTSYDLSVVAGKDKGAKISFDAEVARDKHGLLMSVQSYLAGQRFPDKKVAAKPVAESTKKVEKSRTPQEDADLKWMESLKEGPAMELTEENIQRLVKAIRAQGPNEMGQSGIMIRLKYEDRKAGFRIDRYKNPGDFFNYIATYKFPNQDQKSVQIAGSLSANKDNEVGTKLYRALVDSIEGREPTAEIPSEKKQVIATLAKMAESMDKKTKWFVATERSEQIKFRGRDALLRIRKEFVPKETEGVDEREKGHMTYTLSLMFAPETKVYARRFVTDRPLMENWNDLGGKLYKTLEDAVDKKKK